MGHKAREQKKRQVKAEQARKKARRVQREKGKEGKKSSAWWLTIVTTTTCCARCAGMLREGRDMVYRATPREARCVSCAEAAGLSYRPSVAWEDARRRTGRARSDSTPRAAPGRTSTPTGGVR